MRKPKRVRDDLESAPDGLAVSKSGDMACLWRTGDDRKPRIQFAYSKNRGAMWKKPIELPVDKDSEANFPQLSRLPGGDYLAAWEGVHDRASAIFLSRSADNGSTWSEPTIIEEAESLATTRVAVEQGLAIAYRSTKTKRIQLAFLK